MNVVRFAFAPSVVTLLLLAGCATPPDVQSRREAVDAEIDAILSMQLDAAEYGETRRCLSNTDFRTFRPLGDRHILFEGRGDRIWINTLRGRCFDLRYGDVLIVRKYSGTRMCDADRFEVAEWFDWPWYRRWPWHWGAWGTGATCSLGKFQPVTRAQVNEIKDLLKSR